VDDKIYAEKFYETYKNSLGEKAIRYKLFQKGVEEKVINELFSNVEFDISVPKKIAEKYLKNKQITSQNLAKCYKYLLSKGFSYSVANEIISKYKQD
jgi:SOS response regulatory protein OraA/RecX